MMLTLTPSVLVNISNMACILHGLLERTNSMRSNHHQAGKCAQTQQAPRTTTWAKTTDCTQLSVK